MDVVTDSDVTAGQAGSGEGRSASRRRRSQAQIDESARMKAAIVAAASGVFASKGYTQTTLKDVADVVGLTRPGVLHHFPSKEALFLAVLEQGKDWAASVWTSADVVPRDEPRLGPIAAFVGGSSRMRQALQFAQVLEGEAISGNEHAEYYVSRRNQLVRRLLTEMLAERQRAGLLDEGLDVEVLSVMVAGVVSGLQRMWLINPDLDTQAAFEMFERALFHGLGPKPAE